MFDDFGKIFHLRFSVADCWIFKIVGNRQTHKNVFSSGRKMHEDYDSYS